MKEKLSKKPSTAFFVEMELQDGKIDVSGIFAREEELLPDWADSVHYVTSRVDEQAEYFSINIKTPGEYAWIVQVADGQKLWKQFWVN